MPDIKKFSTGRLGNTWDLHPNTDHVNTKGLDLYGIPGVEAYIDEDIVRAYDDNRPLVNLLSNDDQMNRTLDSSAKNKGVNALLKNSYDDWKLSIDSLGYYTDPENFLSQISVTPLRVSKGVAQNPADGYVATGPKKLVGFKKTDGTTLWVDEHSWYYSTSVLLDDPDAAYSGFYRPIYVETPESSLPTNYSDYELTVRQLYSTGNVYSYSIYMMEDFVVPFSSSVFSITNKAVNFDSSEYPYYNHYPTSYYQLVSPGLGILEIGEDAVISKNLKRKEHKLTASQFFEEGVGPGGSLYKAELQEDVFRLDKSANMTRIENDTNFLRAMTGVKAYNQTSRVYFNSHKDSLGKLVPLIDNRDFLGNQELSFEVGMYDVSAFPETADWEETGRALMNAESGNTSQFNGGITADVGTTFTADVEAANSLYGNYGYKLNFYNDAIRCFGTYSWGPATSEVAVRAYVYISEGYKVSAAGGKVGVLGIYAGGGTTELVSISLKASATTTVDSWDTLIVNAAIPVQTIPIVLPNKLRSRFHKIELHFKKGTPGTAEIWVDDVLIRSDYTVGLGAYSCNAVIVGPSQNAGLYPDATTKAGSYMYVDDVKLEDANRVTEYSSRYRKIYATSPETRGYQDFGCSKTNPDLALSIVPGTYTFNIQLNNDVAPNLVSVALTGTDTLHTIATKIQYQFDNYVPLIYAWARVLYKAGSWDLRVYSKSSGDYSKVLISTGTGNDLAVAMGGSYQVPQDGRSDWNIYFDNPPSGPVTQGDHKAIRSGGITTQNDFVTFDAESVGNQVFLSMVLAGFDNFTVGIKNDVNFSHNSEMYIMSNGALPGYRALGMTVTDPNLDSGLTALSTYYFKLAIDGGALVEYSFTTTTDTSYNGVMNSINSIIAGYASMMTTADANSTYGLALPLNDLVFISESYGPYSLINIANGVTGASLFGSGSFPSAGSTLGTAGVGKVISIRPRPINTFTIFQDSVKQRAVYSHNDSKLYVTPDVETDIRDHVDTEEAYNTRTSADRWSTHNDRVMIVSLSGVSGWTSGAEVSNTFSVTIGSDNYLLIGNTKGQVFFYKNGNLYDEDMLLTAFTGLTIPWPGTAREKINNFFVYSDTVNSRKYLFVLAQSFIFYANITAGISGATSFSAVNTNVADPAATAGPKNVTDSMFSLITDAESWEAYVVNPTTLNRYIIFVGHSAKSTWESAPILYALYNTSTYAFYWYAEENYKRFQIDKVCSIVKYNGWQDPVQSSELFIANNANGPEIWSGNSQNNSINISAPGDDRFNKFSWMEANFESGANSLALDAEVEKITFAEVHDNRIFFGGKRFTSSTFGGIYSYGMQRLQRYTQRDSTIALEAADGSALYTVMYRNTIGNTDPAIVKISQEVDEGRAQIFSRDNLQTVSSWPSDSAFRITLTGFNVGGIVYDGEYNVVFDGNQANLADIVKAINGDIGARGFSSPIKISTFGADNITPVIRARALVSYEYSGGTYTPQNKIVIESKIQPDSGSGHTSPLEATQSDCSITISHPTTGSTVVGTGSNTMEILPGTIAYANLPLIDWGTAECTQLKRTPTTSLSFGVNNYVNISSMLASGYKVLTGSLRVKSNSTNEIGYSQGEGRIISGSTVISLTTGTYSFKVQFDSGAAAGVAESTRVTITTTGASLSGKYWLLNSPVKSYYVWYNVATLSSVDPAPFGRTGIQININPGDSTATVATKTQLVLNSHEDFTASVSVNNVTVTNKASGNVVDVADVNAGITVLVLAQGTGGSVTNNVILSISGPITITALLAAINAQLSAGVASLYQLGSTGEYCDIVITSTTIGDTSSVLIGQSKYGTYLFGSSGLSLVPNKPVSGSTALATPGSQTFGFTWENIDYFVEYNHPSTGQVRIYIADGVGAPFGFSRIPAGATIWVDFWQWKKLTKISAKAGFPPVNNLPLPGQWTFNLEEKKIVLGSAPSKMSPPTVPHDDIIFVDAKIKKVLEKIDLGSSIPSDQLSLSNIFHATQPRNLENSEVSVARSLARINALHYGIDLWSSDSNDGVVVDYSYFLPRLDVLAVRRDADQYGNRVFVMKGIANSSSPFVELPLLENENYTPAYATYINSQDYSSNNIVEMPWYKSGLLDEGKIFLDGSIHFFRPESEFVSERGLAPLSRQFEIDKVIDNNAYKAVRITDPVGVLNFRNRDTSYNNIDASLCIFLDTVAGNDANDGTSRDAAVQTLVTALSLVSSDRPYVIITRTSNLTNSVCASATINSSFKVYLIAEYIATIPVLTVSSSCYLQGISVTTNLVLTDGHDVSAKYCYFEEIVASGTGTFANGIHASVKNSVVNLSGISITYTGGPAFNITGAIEVEFEHVFIKSSVQLLNFNPSSYNTSLTNSFTFNHVTNSSAYTGIVINCPHSLAITIEINDSILPGDTVTRFASDASVSINRSLTYSLTNSGSGSLVTNEGQVVSVGDIAIDVDTGAPHSIARGFDADSFAINYIDRHIDAGAFLEERIPNALKNDEQDPAVKSFLHVHDSRIGFKYNLLADKFSFYIKLKPAEDFQVGYVIFDSRYDGDFDADSGLFNKNAMDFMQIVYDNKTYGASYLIDWELTPGVFDQINSHKYCFKLIVSNGYTTNVAVIGPYFTVEDHAEYNLWHELAIQLELKDVYNNKYESADLSGLDKNRTQTIISTVFDGKADRVYALKNHLFEDASSNNIATSTWYPGMTMSRFFNIGGGWTGTWLTGIIPAQWSTWAESRAHATIENFLISHDALPVNMLKDLDSKEVIDLYYNDYRVGRLDDKTSGIICHCDNAFPFSENGLQPDEASYVAFRPYEGFDAHALAIESYSPNLIAEGRIKRGNWFDRSIAYQWNSNSVTHWGVVTTQTDGVVAVLYQESTNLKISLVRMLATDIAPVVLSTTTILAATASEATLIVAGSYVVAAYVKADTFAYYTAVDVSNPASPVLGTERIIRNAGATNYLSAHVSHSSANVVFSFHSNSRGYLQVQVVTTGTVLYGPTDFSSAINISYNAVASTYDKDGNQTYVVAWRESASNDLKYVMYKSDLSATSWAVETLTTGEQPIDLKVEAFSGVGNTVIKWKSYVAASDSATKIAIIDKGGLVVLSPTTIFGTGDPTTKTDDVVLTDTARMLFAMKDRTTQYIKFKVFEENGTELTNSPYLRLYDLAAVSRVYLTKLTTSGRYCVSTDVSSTARVIVLDNEVPSRWYKDFSGTFDNFEASVQKTGSLFGWAAYINFNHASSAGQGWLWQTVTIGSTAQHFITGYYTVRSGSFIIELQGTALTNPIQINFINSSVDEDVHYNHITKGSDTVNFLEVYPLNFKRIFKFVIGFTPNGAGDLSFRVKSTNSSNTAIVDDFLVDNVRVELGEHPTSIENSTAGGALIYNYFLGPRGSAYFRVTPEFFFDTSNDHSIFQAHAIKENGSSYVTHSLIYNSTERKFIFSVQDSNLTTGTIESNTYGDASISAELTDLREPHNIVCNWDVEENFIEMYIDNDRYYDTMSLSLNDFLPSVATIIGNSRLLDSPADALFDLIRIGEDPLTELEVNTLINKIDPFVRKSETDVGVVNVKALSFYGITSSDVYDATIYTEKVGDSWNLVIDKGSGFQDNVVIRHEGVNIVTFGSQGMTVAGTLQVSNLVAATITNVVSVGDHITLKFGFTGYPQVTDDAYIEVERGNYTNSELRYDASQQAWVFRAGSDQVVETSENRLSIDGRSIGTWKSDEDWDIDVNGAGFLRIKSGTSPADGSLVRGGGTERVKISNSETVFNGPQSVTHNFRVASGSVANMLFVNSSAGKVYVGRGTATSAIGDLIVNSAITVQYVNDSAFGRIEFRRNTGGLAGYIGAGDGSNYWEIVSSGTYLSLNSDLQLVSGKVIRWADDTSYTKLAYTADATTVSIPTPTNYHGVYCSGYFTAYKVLNNVWNDYAEAFEFDKDVVIDPQPGFVYKMTARGLVKSDMRADKAAIGVYSDTYGQLMGAEGIYDPETKSGYKLPIGLAGKVKVWIKERVEIGDMLISDYDGFATKAELSELYPDLILGKALEESSDETPKRIWMLIK